MTVASYFDYDYIEETKNVASFDFGGKILLIILIILALLVVASLVLSIIMMIKYNKLEKRFINVSTKVGNIQNTTVVNDIGAVFCKKCGSQYSASNRNCPFCGEKR